MVNIMKKSYYVVGIIIIVLIVAAAVALSSHDSSAKGNSNQTEVQTVSQGGVIVKFPSDWVVAKSQTNDTVVAIADSKTLDSSKNAKVNVNIEKRDLEGQSLNTYFNKTYSSLLSNSSNQLISLGNSTAIKDKECYEADYVSDKDADAKEHRAIWVESNGQAYVILCTAPQKSFENYNKYFNYIINNIKIE